MVDAFCSLYTKDFRHVLKDDEPEKALPCPLFDAEENFLPEKDSKVMLSSVTLSTVIYNPQRDEEVIRKLARKRMQTTYQASYKDPGGRRTSDSFSDEFMNYFNKAFEDRTHPVLKPPETCGRINGYSRFDLFYTGRTTYQEEICLEAYKVFKRDFDAGVSRLFKKPGSQGKIAADQEKD